MSYKILHNITLYGTIGIVDITPVSIGDVTEDHIFSQGGNGFNEVTSYLNHVTFDRLKKELKKDSSDFIDLSELDYEYLSKMSIFTNVAVDDTFRAFKSRLSSGDLLHLNLNKEIDSIAVNFRDPITGEEESIRIDSLNPDSNNIVYILVSNNGAVSDITQSIHNQSIYPHSNFYDYIAIERDRETIVESYNQSKFGDGEEIEQLIVSDSVGGLQDGDDFHVYINGRSWKV